MRKLQSCFHPLFILVSNKFISANICPYCSGKLRLTHFDRTQVHANNGTHRLSGASSCILGHLGPRIHVHYIVFTSFPSSLLLLPWHPWDHQATISFSPFPPVSLTNLKLTFVGTIPLVVIVLETFRLVIHEKASGSHPMFSSVSSYTGALFQQLHLCIPASGKLANRDLLNGLNTLQIVAFVWKPHTAGGAAKLTEHSPMVFWKLGTNCCSRNLRPRIVPCDTLSNEKPQPPPVAHHFCQFKGHIQKFLLVQGPYYLQFIRLISLQFPVKSAIFNFPILALIRFFYLVNIGCFLYFVDAAAPVYSLFCSRLSQVDTIVVCSYHAITSSTFYA